MKEGKKDAVLAIIPARGGSKGIPKKNIVSVAGKPLIAWTIEAAKKSRVIDRIVVSSDSDEILEVAQKYGVECIKRPVEISTDTATAEAVLEHTLTTLKGQGYKPDLVIYLQPTSPLRTAAHIDQAMAFFKEKKADALISVAEGDNKFLKAFLLLSKGFLGGVVNNIFPFMNRQDLPPIYMSNGAIYILRVGKFFWRKTFWSRKTVPFVMTPEESIDIDTLADIEKVSNILISRGD